ncbi:D-alanyl-D-alanine carboxypeptidase family protein [Bacillus sp. SCS-153A]|uniref:D-alanyl-D-alanine carboxypeptidase family protein n=1 Tax=Rossellomorea sedimentorum TaxID=3115294 RepID=UPI00390652EF
MKKMLIAILLLFITSTSVHAEGDVNQKPSMLFSESGVMIDMDTRTILYSKNAKRRMAPASITKVATAIYAVEKGDLDSLVTVSKEAAETEGSTVYLLEGEELTLKQLLTGMMINSGNDAAVAIAEHLDGSVEQFSENLNKFLEEKAGVINTHFTNPHGLYEERHYTTAEDMALITSYAMKNEAYRELFALKEVDWKGKGWETTLFNHHKMVKGEMIYPEVTGGKNGYVDESKHTLVTTASNETLSVAVVLLKAQSKTAVYKDTSALLDYGLNQFTHYTIPKGEVYSEGEIEFFSDKDITYTGLKGVKDPVSVGSNGGLVYLLDGNPQIIGELTPMNEKPVSAEQELVNDGSGGLVKSQLVLYPVYLYVGLLLIAGTAVMRKKMTAE